MAKYRKTNKIFVSAKVSSFKVFYSKARDYAMLILPVLGRLSVSAINWLAFQWFGKYDDVCVYEGRGLALPHICYIRLSKAVRRRFSSGKEKYAHYLPAFTGYVNSRISYTEHYTKSCVLLYSYQATFTILDFKIPAAIIFFSKILLIK